MLPPIWSGPRAGGSSTGTSSGRVFFDINFFDRWPRLHGVLNQELNERERPRIGFISPMSPVDVEVRREELARDEAEARATLAAAKRRSKKVS